MYIYTCMSSGQQNTISLLRDLLSTYSTCENVFTTWYMHTLGACCKLLSNHLFMLMSTLETGM